MVGEALSTRLGGRPSVTHLGQSRPHESPYLIIITLHEPVWSNLPRDAFGTLQSMMTRSRGILWVTRGATDCNPDANLLLGLSECLRSENRGLKLITLDLDQRTPLSDADTVDMIYRTFRYAFDPGRQDVLESEYREREGVIQIARVVADAEKDEFVMQGFNGSMPYPQAFLQDDRPLKLNLRTPGLLDSIFFDDHDQIVDSIGDDEVEIAVKAAGVSIASRK